MSGHQYRPPRARAQHYAPYPPPTRNQHHHTSYAPTANINPEAFYNQAHAYGSPTHGFPVPRPPQFQGAPYGTWTPGPGYTVPPLPQHVNQYSGGQTMPMPHQGFPPPQFGVPTHNAARPFSGAVNPMHQQEGRAASQDESQLLWDSAGYPDQFPSGSDSAPPPQYQRPSGPSTLYPLAPPPPGSGAAAGQDTRATSLAGAGQGQDIPPPRPRHNGQPNVIKRAAFRSTPATASTSGLPAAGPPILNPLRPLSGAAMGFASPILADLSSRRHYVDTLWAELRAGFIRSDGDSWVDLLKLASEALHVLEVIKPKLFLDFVEDIKPLQIPSEFVGVAHDQEHFRMLHEEMSSTPSISEMV